MKNVKLWHKYRKSIRVPFRADFSVEGAIEELSEANQLARYLLRHAHLVLTSPEGASEMRLIAETLEELTRYLRLDGSTTGDLINLTRVGQLIDSLAYVGAEAIAATGTESGHILDRLAYLDELTHQEMWNYLAATKEDEEGT